MKNYKKIILTLAIIFSFISIAPTLAIATEKEQRVFGLVSVGLATVSKSAILAGLTSVGLAYGFKMNYSLQTMVDDYVKETSIDYLTTHMATSDGGLIAMSYDLIQNFKDFIDNYVAGKNASDSVGSSKILFKVPSSAVAKSYDGYTYGPFPYSVTVGKGIGGKYSTMVLSPGNHLVFEYRPSNGNPELCMVQYNPAGGVVQGLNIYFNYSGSHFSTTGVDSWGLYAPTNELTDYDGKVYGSSSAGVSDYIVKPSWNVNHSTADGLQGRPELPWQDTYDKDSSIGTLKPDDTIVEEKDKEPTKPDIPDIPLPDGFLPTIEIKNHSNGKKLVPYHDYGKEAKFIDILIHGKSWLTLSDAWTAPKDDEIKNSITKSATFTFGNKTQNNAIVKNFEWEKSPSSIVANSLGGREVSFKVLFQVPYPHGDIEGDVFMVNMDLYSSSKRAGYSTHTAKLNNMKFTILNNAGDIPETEIGPHPPIDSNGDNICDSSNPDNPHPPTDSDGDGNCDHNNNGGGTTNPPTPPEGGGDEGDGKPEFPKPPISTDIWEWVAYLMDVITYFFRILIWVVTRPFIFVFDSIKTLGSYITSGLTTMADVGTTVKAVLTWIPEDIMNIFWGIFSLIITFCSIKLFKNFANK